MKSINIVFIGFLIIVFIMGMYMYSTNKLDDLFLSGNKLENMENGENQPGDKKTPCPDLLIRRGNVLLLYNSNVEMVEGVNPLPFYNLDEYINYLEIERRKGRDCPVLFLQHESTTQGEDVYRMRPNPFQTDPGLMPLSAAAMVGKMPTRIPAPVIDANRAYPPYNQGNYPGFDSHGLMIGVYSKIDEVHDSTAKGPDGQSFSDNPMDPNWGGVLYTQGKVESGKYDENNVTRPIYPQTVNMQYGMFGQERPPSEFPQPKKA
jgi:hypothetical protein